MRRIGARQSHAFWQHGCPAQVFLRRYRQPVAVGRAGRQTRGRVHLHQLVARRTGNHALVHDVAVAASRHADHGSALHRARLDGNHGGRHALRTESPRRHQQRPQARRRGKAALPGARRARGGRGETPASQMSVRFSGRSLTLGALGALGVWLALWLGWWTHATASQHALWLVLALAPLVMVTLFVVRGAQGGFVWCGFVSLGYFAQGVTVTLTSRSDAAYGAVEIFLSLLLFTAASATLRARRQRA